MDRPNILWIQTDEQRPDSLGCYGSAWARTPYLDALARRGVVFDNCVCNSPVCVPSRVSQLTARYPQEMSTLTNNVSSMNGVYPAGTETFPERFAAAGYATASFGKWHTPNHPTWQLNQGLINLEQYSGYYALNPDYDHDAHGVILRPGGTPIILAGTYPVAHGHPSEAITDWAIAWLRQRPADQPFLLRVSHNWPHTPVLPPPPYDVIYDPDDLPIRYFDEAAYATRAAYDRARADLHRMAALTRDQQRQMWAQYMGLVACVDHEVGRMLSALRALGLEKNTVVLFSADHGKALGEWGATEKGFFDSEVWRVPMILAGPGVPEGRVDRAPCELIDTARTFLGLAGLDAPDVYCGRDLTDADVAAPETVYGQIGWPEPDCRLLERVAAFRQGPTEDIRGRDALIWQRAQGLGAATPLAARGMRVAVRDSRYRLDVTWMRDGRRLPQPEADGNLFDLVADPEERRNLWGDARVATTQARLWAALEDWFAGLDAPEQVFDA